MTTVAGVVVSVAVVALGVGYLTTMDRMDRQSTMDLMDHQSKNALKSHLSINDHQTKKGRQSKSDHQSMTCRTDRAV
jgi:hypothetical protein